MMPFDARYSIAECDQKFQFTQSPANEHSSVRYDRHNLVYHTLTTIRPIYYHPQIGLLISKVVMQSVAHV